MKKEELSAEKINNLVIKPEKWIKKKYKIPYVIKLFSERQKLYIIGVSHNDFRNRQITTIERLFKDFLRNGNKNSVLATELKIPQGEKFNSKMEALKKYGEFGLAAFLSKEKGLSRKCFEPNMKEIFDNVKKMGYGKMDIVLWSFFNAINFRWSQEKSGENKEMLKKTIIRLDKLIGINKIKNKKNILKNIEKNYFNYFSKRTDKILGWKLPQTFNTLIDIKSEIRKKIKTAQDPFFLQTEINRIGSAVNWNRDILMAKKIMRILNSGKSVFAVCGANHTVAQEPLMKKFFNLMK
ncbi:MAG: hypothetical protein PHZ25_00925 [Candidatus Pacebacteria bacterium]|nr:hypothetical protein [Candidatus Paceibacterota bacterium]